jgi:cyclase
MGDASELAARYRDQGADELVFYDITASPEGRTLDYGWVRDIARLLDIPFCVAGGIRSVDQAAALPRPRGRQGVDQLPRPRTPRPDRRDGRPAGLAVRRRRRGLEALRRRLGRAPIHRRPAASRGAGPPHPGLDRRGAGRLGAGEIVLNCMDEDGVRQGYDVAQLTAARARLTIPLVASGGAGSAAHFLDVFEQADVSGALAASVFHTGNPAHPRAKGLPDRLRQEVRP